MLSLVPSRGLRKKMASIHMSSDAREKAARLQYIASLIQGTPGPLVTCASMSRLVGDFLHLRRLTALQMWMMCTWKLCLGFCTMVQSLQHLREKEKGRFLTLIAHIGIKKLKLRLFVGFAHTCTHLTLSVTCIFYLSLKLDVWNTMFPHHQPFPGMFD